MLAVKPHRIPGFGRLRSGTRLPLISGRLSDKFADGHLSIFEWQTESASQFDIVRNLCRKESFQHSHTSFVCACPQETHEALVGQRLERMSTTLQLDHLLCDQGRSYLRPKKSR